MCLVIFADRRVSTQRIKSLYKVMAAFYQRLSKIHRLEQQPKSPSYLIYNHEHTTRLLYSQQTNMHPANVSLQTRCLISWLAAAHLNTPANITLVLYTNDNTEQGSKLMLGMREYSSF